MVSLATMCECGGGDGIVNVQMHVHAFTDEWVVTSKWRIDDVVHCLLLDRLLPGRLGTYIFPLDAVFHLRAHPSEEGSVPMVNTRKEGTVRSRKGKANVSENYSSLRDRNTFLIDNDDTRVEVSPTCKTDLLEAIARERELGREEGRAKGGSGVDEKREDHELGGRQGKKEKEGIKDKSRKNSKRGEDTVLQYEPSVHHLTVPTALELEEEDGGGVVEEEEGEDGGGEDGGEEDEEEEEEDEVGEAGGETEMCEPSGSRSKEKKSKGGISGGGGAGKRIDDEYTDEEGGFEDDGVE